VCFLLLCTGCVRHVESHSILINVGSSIDEKLEIARSIATPARLDLLRQEIKARVPGVTDAQLQGLDLRAARSVFKGFDGSSSESVTVTVVVQHDGKFAPEPMIQAAVAILDAEISGR